VNSLNGTYSHQVIFAILRQENARMAAVVDEDTLNGLAHASVAAVT
jgi:hypothetical protein